MDFTVKIRIGFDHDEPTSRPRPPLSNLNRDSLKRYLLDCIGSDDGLDKLEDIVIGESDTGEWYIRSEILSVEEGA